MPLSRLKWIRWLVYISVGYFIGATLHESGHTTVTTKCQYSSSYVGKRQGKSGKAILHSTPVSIKSNIYIGMMSASKYISNRIQRSLDTWLQKGTWKVEVFADGDPSTISVPPGLDFSIITLPSVDDKAYPPQKKCFMMIRHMFDNYIDDYDWFLRVDDDVYLDYSRLSQLLNNINSSLPIFFGSPGFGVDADDGMEPGMYYLMGGTGMILSRGLLQQLRKHLSYCIQHMYSPHEDVEIGRCIWKHARDVIIPKAWEILEYFYQQYDKRTGDVVNVVLSDLSQRSISKFLSYHAVKSESLHYQLHKLVLNMKIEALLNETAAFKREIQRMNGLIKLQDARSLSPKHHFSDLPVILGDIGKVDGELDVWPEASSWHPRSPLIIRYQSQLPWRNWNKYYGYQADRLVPMKGHSKREQTALWRWMGEIEERYVRTSCPEFKKDFQFVNGYIQSTAKDGVFLAAEYKSYSDSGMRHCNVLVHVGYGVTLLNEVQGDLFDFLPQTKHNAVLNLDVPWSSKCQSSPQTPHVLLVVPLQGRYRELERFMKRYEREFLHDPATQFGVQLAVVLLDGDDDLGLKQAAANLLRNYQISYGTSAVQYHEAATGGRSFSRGAGIQLGSLLASPHDILFLMDIDMAFTPSLINQCRKHACKGATAWYPISFSQYDPDRLCYEGSFVRNFGKNSDLKFSDIKDSDPGGRRIQDRIVEAPLNISEERGFWRDFGFGIACMYKSDFIRAGGFDLTIEGWGEEDIRMYLSLLKSGMDVFRSKQTDLVHIFHPKHCDKTLRGEQARSCRSTKLSHYASQRCLARTYFNMMKRKT